MTRSLAFWWPEKRNRSSLLKSPFSFSLGSPPFKTSTTFRFISCEISLYLKNLFARYPYFLQRELCFIACYRNIKCYKQFPSLWLVRDLAFEPNITCCSFYNCKLHPLNLNMIQLVEPKWGSLSLDLEITLEGLRINKHLLHNTSESWEHERDWWQLNRRKLLEHDFVPDIHSSPSLHVDWRFEWNLGFVFIAGSWSR